MQLDVIHAQTLTMFVIARVDNKGSIKQTIWPVQDVFGKSCARDSNIDQSEHSIQMANCGHGLKCFLMQA